MRASKYRASWYSVQSLKPYHVTPSEGRPSADVTTSLPKYFCGGTTVVLLCWLPTEAAPPFRRLWVVVCVPLGVAPLGSSTKSIKL